VNDPLWRCKDGRLLHVGQMSDAHLSNAITMIERTRGWRLSWLPRLKLEQLIRAQGLSSLRKR
jgi:hypothetical protein